MKPNLIYFNRNAGEWNWAAHLEIKSWVEFQKSPLSIFNKLRVMGLVLAQMMLGHFQMWTKVEFGEDQSEVRHSTRIKKWGLSWYRSEKIFTLDPDGHGILLQGSEYFWPALFRPAPFKSQEGIVDSSATKATYQMPFLGSFVNCVVVMDGLIGTIEINTSWLEGKFVLTQDSLKKLSMRF